MYRFLFLLICMCHLYSQVDIEPLCDKYYRPGTWWPMRLKMPSQVPKKINVSIENFHWKFREQSEYTGYFLITKKLSLCKVYNKKQLLYNKHISLQKLKNTDYLIGIYSKHNTILPISDKPHFFVSLNWLPERWEGLSSFNSIIINANLEIQSEFVLQQWVRAGGTLFVTAKYIPSFIKDGNFDKKNLSYGHGKVHLLTSLSTSEITTYHNKNHCSLVKIKQLRLPPIQKKKLAFFFSSNFFFYMPYTFFFN